MSAHLEIIVPIVVALYTGLHDNGKCEIKKAKTPISENICQGLRAGLEEGCEHLLSIRIKDSGLTLAGKYSVTPVAFPALVKRKMGEAYYACDDFWGGPDTFEQYSEKLAAKASVLNELFASVSPDDPARKAVVDALTASGVQSAQVQDTDAAVSDLSADCATTNAADKKILDGCTKTQVSQSTPPVVPSPTDEILSKIKQSLDDLTTEVRQFQRDAQTNQSRATWRQLASVPFATGRYSVSASDCASSLETLNKLAIYPPFILISGSADERGSSDMNDILSLQRAAAAAACISSSVQAKGVVIQILGGGAVSTPTAGYGRARAATIYIQD